MLALSFGEIKGIVANVLPWETRIRIVGALVEGSSIRATARQFSVDKNAVMALALRVGEGCAHLHSKLVRGLAAYVVQCDETWSFIGKKEVRCDPSKDPAEWGDVYSFLALDAASKLVISFHVGKRDQASTDAFIGDLRARLRVVPHLTTDGWKPYLSAVGESFPGCVDFGQVVKNYRQGASRGPDHRYEPPRDPFIVKTPISGSPREETMSTSHVERLNLTMRHTVGRTRRLCLAFSKTLRGHHAAMALGVMAYNFTKIHSAIETSPAVFSKLTDHVWTIGELVMAALDAASVDDPEPVKLALPPGHVSAVRELPNGRGFLRVVGGPASTAASAAPSTPATTPQVAPSAVMVAAPVDPVVASPSAVAAPADPTGQLDLLAWRPKPKALPKGQLNLFGEQ